MPVPDLPSPEQRNQPRRRGRRRNRSLSYEEPRRSGGKRKRKPDLDDGGVPVEPNKPHNLSGGAAAALDFDD